MHHDLGAVKLDIKQSIGARKALSALSMAEVLPWLDVRKLVESNMLLEIAEMSVEHVLAHGDNTYAKKTIELLAGTRYQNGLIRWMSERTGISIQRIGAKFVFSVLRENPNEKASLRVYINATRGSIKQATKPARGNGLVSGSKIKKAKKDEPYIDILDSPGRLHGSFGTGKRR